MPGKEGESFFRREKEAFSRVSPEDTAFVRKIDNQLKFSEWIEDPKKEQLGKAIAFVSPADPDNEEEEDKRQIVGRIFPLAEDDSRHLIVFKNRRMVVVEAFPAPDEKIKKERLKNHRATFAYKPTALNYSINPDESIDEQIGNVIDWLNEDANVTMSNDPQDELPTFNPTVVIAKAMNVARRLKEKRENKFDRDIKVMMEAYTKEFGKTIFPPRNQPPHETPPSVEPPPTS